MIAELKKDVSIWNINSFAEFYLQIFEKYQSDFELGLKRFKETSHNSIIYVLNGEEFIKGLEKI